MNEMVEVTISMPETTEITSDLSGNTSEVAVSEGSNSENVTGMDPEFYRAALKGDKDAFKQKGKDVEFLLTPNKNTVLHIHFTAYRFRVSEEFVEKILRMCPSLVMKANAKDETLLHVAARYGHSEIVRILIERAKALPENSANEVGAEKKLIRAINYKKDTALHEAVRYHHTELVKILTEEDRDHSYLANSNGETPLYLAAERAYLDLVEEILKNCNSPTHDGPNRRTALHAAVFHNRKDMVEKLFTRTLARQEDEKGYLPLHLAALYGYSDLTELLLQHDRNMAYIRDEEGRTALHLAAWCGHVVAMEKIIECCPDCVELADKKGKNALHYAIIGNNGACAKRILNNPSLSNLYNEKDDGGNTPLHHFVRSHISNPFPMPMLFPLLWNRHCKMDTMAFNKQNQSVVDVACNTTLDPDRPDIVLKSVMVRLIKAFGARPGQRIQIGDEKKDENEKKDKNEKSDDPIIETRFLVATLIATVTFAAGFTLPGGTIQDGEHQGSPILKHNPAFQAFVITDCIALVLSSSAVLTFFYLTDAYIRTDKNRRAKYVATGTLLTEAAMTFMIIAFVTGTYAVLGPFKGIGAVTPFIGLSFFLAKCKLFLDNYRFMTASKKFDPYSLVKYS